ncbi:MAG TPA: polynucleotide adenylyltransferase PcnB [Syntrophales bacterium]|nr:polynucleotide adenylyltransferase PcnB [Syntrophales bacterium]
MDQVMPPLIIPRKGHNISRKQINPHALRTLYRLRDEGFVAYLVGGCVRDLLLKRPPKDFDIATDATPGQIKRLFRNCRLIGRRFRLAHLHFPDEILEVSTFRAAAPDIPAEENGAEEADRIRKHPRHLKDDDGMVLRDNVFGTPEEDARRRDFTINALAYNIADFSVIDYTTGLRDLRERIIRPIGDPLVRFTEDPVRMLRAVRFAASHDFTIEPAAWEAIRRLAPTISRAAPARLYEEVQKLFLQGTALPVFELLDESGLLAALFPGLDRRLREDPRHRGRVHKNLAGLDQLHRNGTPASPALLLAALFGPGLEAEALAHSRDGGIPHQQALDAVCTQTLKEISQTVAVTVRTGDRLRRILASQPALHRRPPRRPAALAARAEFTESLTYLRLTTDAGEGNRPALEWWEGFLAGTPPALSAGATQDDGAVPAEGPPRKRRHRRRRRSRGRAATPATT